METALLAPGFPADLVRACPVLIGATLIRCEALSDVVERVTRFTARPERLGAPLGWLPTVAWVERVRWSRVRYVAAVQITPELPSALARRVHCEGTYTLLAIEGGATMRRVEVSLEIRAPLVGRAAEARLATMLATLFDAEASLLGRRVG